MRRPSVTLRGERDRALRRRLVDERGPDVRRKVDRLKLRSAGGGSEELMHRVDPEQGDGARTHDVTGRDGDTVQVWFMVGVSEVGGTDVVGG